MYQDQGSFTNKFALLNKIILSVAVILIAGQVGFSQGTRGTIRGTITDPNQAIVPNATVRLVDATRGAEVRSVQTNDDGTFQFIEIEPSTYNIVVTASNFSEYKANAIKVEPNRNVVLDIALSIGQVSNDVTVTAGAELIDRESATLGTTVDRQRVEGLPLDGRNVLGLALLQPGVFPAGAGFGNGLGIRVNGSRGVENNVTLDGGNNNEVAVGGAIGGQPRPDAVQEFRLLTSNFEPEFGRNTGSIINVVTKSGTNQFHGNGRFFYRPTKLSAANFLDKALPAGRPAGSDFRQKYERKEYGFNIGGPIYFANFGDGVPPIYNGQDRSFFFVDFEKRYQDIGASQTINNLPSLAERQGNFSGLGTALLDPATGQEFDGNVIPVNRISPIAQYYLQFLPTPDANGQAQVSANQLTRNNYLTIRLDHNITNNHLLNFTANYFDTDAASPFAFGGSDVPGFGSADRRKAWNYVGRYTYVINSNLVNYLLLNYAKNKQPGVAPINTTTPAQIGFTSDFVADERFAGPPSISLFDRDITLGNSIQGPQQRITENMQIQNSTSWVVGGHRFKFGFDATKYKQATDFLFVNQGILTFSAAGLVGETNTTGDDFADFLIGNSPAAVQFGAAGQRDYRQRAFAAFAQDSWRATKNLTLSYGVRYEYNSPLKDKFNRVAYYRAGARSQLLANGQVFTPEGQQVIVQGGQIPRGLVYVGDPDPVLGGTVPVGGVAPDKNNFAPRVGFAYSFNSDKGFLKTVLGENQTVIRGAFGLYYGAVIGDTALQQLSAPGYSGTNFFQFPASGTLADPFAPDPFPTFGGDQGQVPNPFTFGESVILFPLAQFSQPIDPNLKTPQVSQFNVTLERGFARDFVLGLSYVGNRGRKQYVREQINPALGTFLASSLRPEAIPTPSTSNANSRRLNDDVRIGLTQLTSGGNSTYDALQVNFQKRFSDDGLGFQAAYTFSKSINDSDNQRGQLDLLDRRFGRGLSADDHPHRFVFSGIYDFPFFKNTNGFVKRVLDGWSIGGIYTYQSGDVFSVGNPIDIDGTGGALINFADINAPYQVLDPRQNDRQAFNANAFSIADCRVLNPDGSPVSGQNFDRCGGVGRRGTSGRNQFRLDNATNNVDAILAKKIRLFSERNNLELRFEAFNLFNTTQFTTVDLNLGTPTNPNVSFGKYTDTRDARIIQLGARFNF